MRGDRQQNFSRLLPSPVPRHVAEHLLRSERCERFRQVLARRSQRLCIVVEECYDPHNATAIVRTCDALGIHRLIIVTDRNAFQINRRISQGAHHNIDLCIFPEIDQAYGFLRANDFQIYASDLNSSAKVGPGALLPLLEEGPLALVFGNEGHGLSQRACVEADGSFLIPMSGFPQSLNLSVSVAITCYSLRQKALEEDQAGDLSPAEQSAFFDRWLRRSAQVERYCNSQGYPPLDDPLHSAYPGQDRRGEALECFHAKAQPDEQTS